MNQIIYVRLIDEGVDVWRPVVAKQMSPDGLFFILPFPSNTIPIGENWEFAPGTHVLTKEIKLEGNQVRVAFKKID